MKAELGGIAETLLIPVRARAHETALPDGLLQDPWAVEIMAQLDLAQSDKDRVSSATLIGTILRTLLIDGKIREFIDSHPDGVVVNLGCGLDARCNRLRPPSTPWFDLDVEETILLRKQFFDETENCRMISGSMFDCAWMEQVPKDKPVMIFFEGVSMYFPESMLKPFVLEIFRQFPQADVVFDVLAKINARNTKMHPDVKKYNVKFEWGIDSGAELLEWDSRIRLVSEESYMLKGPLHRWSVVWRMIGWLPVIQRMGRVVHIRYEKAG